MKTDPNEACANTEQRLLWALVHDAIAHPLMALSGYARWALAFHDWTSRHAWPRPPVDRQQVVYALERQERWLQQQCDALSAQHDYDCMFFEADAERMREAVQLIKGAA